MKWLLLFLFSSSSTLVKKRNKFTVYFMLFRVFVFQHSNIINLNLTVCILYYVCMRLMFGLYFVVLWSRECIRDNNAMQPRLWTYRQWHKRIYLHLSFFGYSKHSNRSTFLNELKECVMLSVCFFFCLFVIKLFQKNIPLISL